VDCLALLRIATVIQLIIERRKQTRACRLSAVSEFESWLLDGQARCEKDEWVLTSAREEIVRGLKPDEAYAALASALELTEKQDSPFYFANCCWFILALARKADTTQLPSAALSVIPGLASKASLLGEQGELEEMCAWFRISIDSPLK